MGAAIPTALTALVGGVATIVTGGAAAPLAGLAVAGVAGATSAYESAQASKQQAASQAASFNYQAQVAKNNALVSSQNANAELAENNLKVQQLQTQKSQQLAAVRAAMGANGIQLNTGSSLAVQSGVATAGQQSVWSQQFDGIANAISLQNQAQDYSADAGLDTSTAENDITGGNLAATGTIISGASSVASKWASYQQQGVFGNTGWQ
jgi:hypothetical protein